MTGKDKTRSSITRVLATYAVACFVVLQVLDIVLEPLGVPVSAIRWVMLLMIGFAPLLVVAVAWRSRQRTLAAPDVELAASPGVVFRIGHAELDTATRQIRFSGKAVDVQPKVFDLIEFLVRSKSRVVSKEELFNEIWPDVVVSEASLTQSIKRARDLFRQNGFNEEVIRTVSRKGYQFDHSAEITETAIQKRSGAWPDVALPAAAVSLIALLLGILVWNSNDETPTRFTSSNASNSLVVLPFSNLTPDPDFSYFSDGLTETLTNSLTRVHDLRIIARGSAFSFRDADTTYSVIGEELNVAHIVEGTVQRNNGDLRITARLIRASDGYQAWSRIYNRKFDDVFAVQDDISQSIVEQMSDLLSARLVLPEQQAARSSGADNAEAYRLFLLGLDRRKTGTADGLRSAEDNFREALRLRPEYPEAMLGLADAIRLRAVRGEIPRERSFSEALTLIQQTLKVRPDYADAYLQLGEIQHRHFWDFDDAADSYKRALELKPGSADAHSAFSRYLSKVGAFDRSIREAAAALDLDPKSASAVTSLAIRQIRARQLDAARETIEALTQEHPEHVDLPWLETNWHIRSGSYGDALKWIALEELDYLRLSLSAITLFHLNRTAQAQVALDELIASDPDGAAFQIAEVYAQWSEPDQAFEWLERAFRQGDPGLAELYSSINLENLYADSRFTALAARVGLPALTSD